MAAISAFGVDIEVTPDSSLHEVMEQVRQVEKKEPMTVVLQPGVYTLQAPLVFTPEDSGTKQAPVTWKGMDGAVISGGRAITGFKAGTEGLWSVKTDGGFTQLFVNGRRAVRAREPDELYFYTRYVDEEKRPGGTKPAARQTVGLHPDVANRLERLSPEQINGAEVVFYHKWDNTWRRLTGFDSAASEFSMEGRIMKSWNPLKTNTRFHLENFRAALDEPGEWFLDRDGMLFYKPRPGETPDRTTAFAPVIPQWLIIKGDPAHGTFVEHLRFENLSFRHAAYRLPEYGFGPMQAAAELEAAVQVDGARELSFIDCSFEHTGLYGIWLRKGCSNSRIERCMIRDLGAGGIRI
ncbi:MAG: right-handed parallel beta-helix repeat-containing protein, partial [Verrucomicrobiota bacterium]